jgi:hypothetical protein
LGCFYYAQKERGIMAYNANTDYMALIKQRKDLGYGDDDPKIKQWTQERQEKINAATPQQLSQWGVPETARTTMGSQYSTPSNVQDAMLRAAQKNREISQGISQNYSSPQGQQAAAAFGNTASNLANSAYNIDPKYIQSPATYQNQPQQPYQQLQQAQQPNAMQYRPPQYDYAAQIKAQNDVRITSQLAQIKAAYDKSRSSISGAIPGVQQGAKDLRGQNEAYYYAQALPALRAAAEQAGVYKGGDMLKGNVDLLATRGKNLGNINLQEQNELNRIQQSLSDIDTEEQQANIAARAGIEADMYDQLMKAQQWQDDYNLRYGEATGVMPDGTQTLAAIQQAYNQAITDAGLTGYYGGQMTADEKARQWTQKFQEDQAAWEQSTDNPAVKAQILANEMNQLRMQYLPQEYDLQLQQMQQDLQTGKVTTEAQLDQMRANIANMEKQASLARDQFDYEKTSTNDKINEARYNNYYQQGVAMINDATYSPEKMSYVTRYSTDQVKTWVLGLPITPEEKARLLNELGIPKE